MLSLLMCAIAVQSLFAILNGLTMRCFAFSSFFSLFLPAYLCAVAAEEGQREPQV